MSEEKPKLAMNNVFDRLKSLCKRLDLIIDELNGIIARRPWLARLYKLPDLARKLIQIREDFSDLATLTPPKTWRILAEENGVRLPDDDA